MESVHEGPPHGERYWKCDIVPVNLLLTIDNEKEFYLD